MDKDHRVSIETISVQFDISVYTQLFARNWKCGRFTRSLSQGCSEKIRKKDVVMTVGRCSSWSVQIPQFLMLWWPAMKAGSIAMTQRPRDRVPSGSMLALPDPRRPDRANPPTNFWWSLFLTALTWSTCTGFPLDRQSTRNTMLSFKGVQEENPREKASTLQIGSVAFPPGQRTSPQLHPCHWLFDQDGHQDSCSPFPIVQTLLPVTFAYSLSSEVVVMRELRKWKRLWRRSLTRSHNRTSMGPLRSCWNGTTSALQPEEITSKRTRVSCVYYQ